MARENRSDRGAMLALASLMVVFSLAVIGVVPAGAYYYDTDGDGLADFYEIKHGLHATVYDERADWDNDGLNDVIEDPNENGIVDVGETDPWNPDTDGDGISDGIEGLVDSSEDADTLINALDLDSDGDFIPDAVEYFGATDWLDPDSDDDGIIDGWEDMWGTDPLNPNTDGDGWTDGEEIAYGSRPTNPDSDGDGRIDGIGNESNNDADQDGQINALDFDSDNDGVTDSQEDYDEDGVVDTDGETAEVDPELYDTDGDGFSDGYEIYHALSDPLHGEDADGDGWMDGQEVAVFHTDPNSTDTDGDGLGDAVENPIGTPYPGVDTDGDGLIDALDLDSDNDGIDDAEEIVAGLDGYVTSPVLVDTDGDLFSDNSEVQIYGSDPTLASDPGDDDGIPSWDELTIYETNFDLNDTDGDGVDEGLSDLRGDDYADENTDASRPIPFHDTMVNALDWDSDGDGLYDGSEIPGSNPLNFDTDGDGGGDPYLLMDGAEVHIWGTDPNNTDTDGDGVSDYDEIYIHHTDPLDDGNSDGDYASDADEIAWGSNPLDPDTDGDGILDGETVTGTYYNAAGELQEWSFTENGADVELGGDGLPNVLDPDSDWREWEDPPTYVYLDFHDRTEMAYAGYAALLSGREGRAFHVGALNPGNVDTDADGFPDATEVACGFDPLDARDYGDCPYTPDDTDADGLFDVEEAVLDSDLTAPNMWEQVDFDGDGLWDGDEIHPNWWDQDGVAQGVPTNPLDADTDDDTLNDLEEVTAGADGFITNPHIGDTDGDGLPDSEWADHGTDPTDVDSDDDDLYDGYEILTSLTDPLDGDTDEDGIYDGHEVAYATDPLDMDSDNDALVDGWEAGYTLGTIGAYTDAPTFGAGDADPATFTDPRYADSDFDGYADSTEDWWDQDGAVDSMETSPSDRDTDNDLLPDYYEIPGNYTTTMYSAGWIDNSPDPTYPYAADTDVDGLRDDIEFAQLCDPNVVDTDVDGLGDGDEYNTYLTDPSNADTDSDGCNDNVGPGDVESPTVDTDGDQIVNAMDVDSDNDWIWDCSGDETAAVDDDSDGIPNILDNDTDNDNLSDVQEMGLDTWHVFSDNDRDFDEDGIMDGDEYFQVIHQPHSGEGDFRASSPTLFDTDMDGLHDGFEVGKTGPIPVDPIFGGTLPDPGIWDADGTSNSNVYLWDSDMDGLTDLEEDADVDGQDTDIGVTETDPEDDDTDDDGLFDGIEVNTFGTDPLLCSSDADVLTDGLELGLLAPMGDDTAALNPCGSNRYDTVENGAYTTDPLNGDTDGDTLSDSTEDENVNGTRDGNSPYTDPSDWATVGESDPNWWDTDRGGEDDAADVDPVDNKHGDWDIDIDDNAAGVIGNILTIDDGTLSGVAPGMSASADFVVWHTDGANNPDAFDGPSTAATIDSLYVRATSFHWAGQLPGSSYPYPDADDTDWFHYSQVGFSADVIMGLAAGTSQAVTVTVNVPFGAMPGWYLGYVAVETQRQPMPNELPDDWIEVRVYVAEVCDIDICDDDGDPHGVGFWSDPDYFPIPAVDGEMHLVSVPGYPIPMVGMFRVANPNTEPDGVWPWPGGTPDGINDLNGLPALPNPGRTWDTDPPDPQGNINLYDVRAQYEWQSGPMDPTSAISFDNPLLDEFQLGSIDSFDVTVDTTTLIAGYYEGLVRVFEDSGDDNVWNEGECSDTFALKFYLVIPDLDIDDDYGNMSGNEITIDVEPGEIDIMIGEILLYNTDVSTNVDPWDGPSTEPSVGFWYYNPTTNEHTRIPTNPVDPTDPDWIPFHTYSPDLSDTLDVWIGGLLGDSLAIGQSSKLRLWIPVVPATIAAGLYTTNHPDDWVPGDGTVPITVRGLVTGQEGTDDDWLPVIYDEDIAATDQLMDYFHLTINLAELIDAQFGSESMTLTGDPATQVCGTDAVINIGNALMSDVHFAVTNLVGQSHGLVIPAAAVDFSPMNQSIPVGESGEVEICVAIPEGMRGDTYVGVVTLLGGSGTPYDELTLNVVVNCVDEMDILESAYGVVGNLMTLIPGDGGTGPKQFQLVDLGNCDVTGVEASVSGLPDGISTVVELGTMVPWQGFILGTVTADWTAPWPVAATYHGTVTVTADGGLIDSFALDVVIGPGMDIADNAYDVILNTMQLSPDPGGTDAGQFQLVNTGVIDLSGISGVVGDLPDGVSGIVDIAPTCDWASSILGTVDVTWSDPTVPAGEYLTTVTVTANGGLSDNFALKVFIAELANAEFTAEDVWVDGVAGEPVTAVVSVENLGNVDLEAGRITFATADLVGQSGSVIPAANIEVVPATALIEINDTVSFDVEILVPEGLLGQDYSGMLTMFLDGNYLDEIELGVALDRDGKIVIYPNPYNMSEHEGGITIALGDVATEDLSIKVFDMFGMLVADLLGGEEADRDTDVQWDLTNDDGKTVASGMYIVTIDTGDKVVTRKIMVIK